ncbi:MAG TPA: hypothetical protein VIJ25_03105, partial [Methylococcales bacterium]
MGFSCDGGTNWSSDIAYASPTTAFNITNGATGCSSANGSKTIKARVKSGSAYSQNTASDTTYYDNTDPTISDFTANNISISQIRLTPTASDSGSGLNSSPYYYTMSEGAYCSHISNSGYRSTNPYTWGNLVADTQYSFDVKVRDAVANESGYSSCQTLYTSATTPDAPTVNNPDKTTIDVNPVSGGTEKDIAIYVSNSAAHCSAATGGGYVQLIGGALGPVAWQSEAAWGTKTVRGLTTNTTYYVCAKARNEEGDETIFGSSSSATTTIDLPTMTSVSIAGSAVFTSDTTPPNIFTASATPSITLSYTGGTAIYMDFSCNGGTNWSPDIAYASPTTAFNITNGAIGCTTTNGFKTITARAKSADGYSFNTASNTVYYDTTGPTISSFTADNISTTQIELNPIA